MTIAHSAGLNVRSISSPSSVMMSGTFAVPPKSRTMKTKSSARRSPGIHKSFLPFTSLLFAPWSDICSPVASLLRDWCRRPFVQSIHSGCCLPYCILPVFPSYMCCKGLAKDLSIPRSIRVCPGKRIQVQDIFSPSRGTSTLHNTDMRNMHALTGLEIFTFSRISKTSASVLTHNLDNDKLWHWLWAKNQVSSSFS